MPDWVGPSAVATIIALVGYLVRGRLSAIDNAIGDLKDAALGKSDLKVAVLEMASELRAQFSQEFHLRRDAERDVARLERMIREDKGPIG